MKDNIVISSRIRLARNLYKTPFPTNKGEKEGLRVLELVTEAVDKAGDFNEFKMNSLSDFEKQLYFEKHLISKELINNIDDGAVLINNDETISIMVNEEDHIRSQCILKGFSLNEAYYNLSRIDDVLIEELQLAFDNKLGFLTSCPTNVGTGMRASVMLFLPALTIRGAVSGLVDSLCDVGITIRGENGEGTKAEGYLYQVSNKITIGLTEEEIIKKVENAVLEIIGMETGERQKLLSEDEKNLKDFVFRAYGILTSSYKLSSNEFMKYLAHLKLGVSLNIIKLKNSNMLNDLSFITKPATLIKMSGRNLNAEQRDVYRAKYINEKLKDQRL
jgi:protein arginine kinase